MIDTIVLTLNEGTYCITKPNKFEPSARWIIQNANTKSLLSKQNPTKKELLAGTYKPRLTLYNRNNIFYKNKTILKIELSLPKLFFGNNFDELRYKDFTLLNKKLVSILKEMGVETTEEILAKAPVSAVHYSKNILLTDGSTPYHFINKIKEANIKLSIDVNQTDYRNEGHAYKWHCNSYEIVFYDKIKDLEKAKQSNKRAIEKDSDLQLNIFNKLKKRNKPKKFEILRMEVRLNKRQKIKQLFKKLNIKSDLTFKKLFKPAISKKILLHYLDELECKRPALIDYKASMPLRQGLIGQADKALLAALIFNNPDLSPKKILQMFGLKKALETMNMRELRNMFANTDKRSWYMLIADLNEINLPVNQSPFGVIRKSITKSKRLKLT